MRLTRYTVTVCGLFCLLSSSVQADSWTTMYPSDFIHIPMPPVVAPVTWNEVGMGEGSFTSDVLDGTQGTQHLLGAMPFPADMATTGRAFRIR